MNTKALAEIGRGMLVGLVIILVLLLLAGCDCVAGSDAVTTTVCKTDKPE